MLRARSRSMRERRVAVSHLSYLIETWANAVVRGAGSLNLHLGGEGGRDG